MTMVTDRRTRKQQATREHIIGTAVSLFAKHGIDAVTVNQISTAADIGKGTIYNYFDTKEHIVVAFMVDLERKIQERTNRLINTGGSVESVLTAFVRYQFRLKRPHHAFVRVFLAQMFIQPSTFLPYIVEMQKVIDPPLEDLFTALQRRGAIRQDIRIGSLILAFKSMHLGLTALWATEGPPFRGTEQVLATQIKIFSEGLVSHQ